jgi:hypothetical protein
MDYPRVGYYNYPSVRIDIKVKIVIGMSLLQLWTSELVHYIYMTSYTLNT